MDPLLARITIDPAICHGKPCVRGLRYPVEMLLDLLGSGMSHEAILADNEDLERDDLIAAIRYAAGVVRTSSGLTNGSVQSLSDADLDAFRLPDGVLRSQEAYWKALPELLADRKHRGRWVLFHGANPVRLPNGRLTADDSAHLYSEADRLHLPNDEYFVGKVVASDQPPWEPVEID